MTSRIGYGVVVALAIVYAVMWVGGVSAYVFRGGPAAHEAWTAPAFLALAASIVLLTTPRPNAAWLVAVLAAGFASEYAGVRCGCVFGSYEYTTALRPAVLGVPLVMSAAWMVLVAYVQQVRVSAGWNGAWTAALAAGWMTAIDLVLDPVAAGPLGYWRWQQPGAWFGIPLRNFGGWFLIALALFAALSRAAPWHRNGWARIVGFTIVAFFTIIAASFRLVVPAIAGALLCAADVWVSRRQSSSISPGR